MAFPRARIVLAPGGERAPNALVAVDSDDLVIGATRSARQMLGITPEALQKPLPASDLLGIGNAATGDLAQAERAVLQRAVMKAGGNVSAAAQDLGISRATLHRKLARFGIQRVR
jgi:transcriptional regulator of acetoin/glycerol metabolism